MAIHAGEMPLRRWAGDCEQPAGYVIGFSKPVERYFQSRCVPTLESIEGWACLTIELGTKFSNKLGASVGATG
jgi:hypothetical protein